MHPATIMSVVHRAPHAPMPIRIQMVVPAGIVYVITPVPGIAVRRLNPRMRWIIPMIAVVILVAEKPKRHHVTRLRPHVR